VTLAILTPSYAPDLDDFAALHASVLKYTDPSVMHYVVVPDRDLPLFAPLASSRMTLLGESSVLPRSFVSTAWFGRAVAAIPRVPRGARVIALNVRRPWPPLRGWLLQQIVKLSVAMRVECDTLLLVDSDVQLIRPVEERMFASPTAVRLYRNPGAITSGMPRHVVWHNTARRMLGVPPDGPPPYDDPISSFTAWDPAVVRQCTERLAEVSGRDWETAVSREWDFSEFVLYGEYVSTLGTPAQSSFTADDSLCHSHWNPHPLDIDGAKRFVETLKSTDVAVHIQSNSHTPQDIRDYIRAAVN
jgi:hypothetical protein